MTLDFVAPNQGCLIVAAMLWASGAAADPPAPSAAGSVSPAPSTPSPPKDRPNVDAKDCYGLVAELGNACHGNGSSASCWLLATRVDSCLGGLASNTEGIVNLAGSLTACIQSTRQATSVADAQAETTSERNQRLEAERQQRECQQKNDLLEGRLAAATDGFQAATTQQKEKLDKMTAAASVAQDNLKKGQEEEQKLSEDAQQKQQKIVGLLDETGKLEATRDALKVAVHDQQVRIHTSQETVMGVLLVTLAIGLAAMLAGALFLTTKANEASNTITVSLTSELTSARLLIERLARYYYWEAFLRPAFVTSVVSTALLVATCAVFTADSSSAAAIVSDEFIKFLAAAAAPMVGFCAIFAALESRLHSLTELVLKAQKDGQISAAEPAGPGTAAGT